MSVQAMSWVFETSKSEGFSRLVLLAIANESRGAMAWPSLETLCEETNASKPTVLRCIQELIDLGELAVERGGHGAGNTNTYSLPKFNSWLERVKEIRVKKGKEPEDKCKTDPPISVNSERQAEIYQSQAIQQLNQGKPPKTELLEPTYLEPTSTKPTPSVPNGGGQDGLDPFRQLKRLWRRYGKGNLGSLGNRKTQWAMLVQSKGVEKLVAAGEIWAKETGPNSDGLKFPLAHFLKNVEEYIEAAQEPEHADEDDGMPTVASIRRDVERRRHEKA